MDELMLLYCHDGPLFTGRVLFGDAASGERGALTLSVFEKVSFALMLVRLAREVSVFVEREEKIRVSIRRTDLSQPAAKLDEEMILLLHADPVSVIRILRPAPTKIFIRRVDPASLSPLRVGFDALAATFGDDVYVRRRGNQVECACCGQWADMYRTDASFSSVDLAVSLEAVACCHNRACSARLRVAQCSERWVSINVSSLLANPDRERFFFPREWNKSGPWITREELETKYRDWLQIKQEFA